MNYPAPVDPDFEQRVRASFVRQELLNLLNGKIAFISPGEFHIEAPFNNKFSTCVG
jgi:hypothetical protein